MLRNLPVVVSVPEKRLVYCGYNCGQILTQANPPDPDPLEEFRLFAIMATWMEADVVAATVSNALTQGCERVYLADNNSPDETVKVALDAGATLAANYATPHFDEHMHRVMLNALVAFLSLQEGADHIWWLYLDADEFPHGPQGMTLGAYLRTLDRRFRIVGSRVFFHYPTDIPHYASGRHPLDFQPLCEEIHVPNVCPAQHWKHPLQRYDRYGPFIASAMGAHSITTGRVGESALEPPVPIFTHHFQYRDEEVTRRRLALLSFDPATGQSRTRLMDAGERGGSMHRRHRQVDAVYGRRWEQISIRAGNDAPGVHPRPWRELVSDDDARVARWYGDGAGSA